jgi:phosphoglycolate phosphatase
MSMRAPIEAVIFDKDGVLVDFERTWTPAIRAAALDFAEGDAARAHELLVRVGFDENSGTFLPGSIWAAGTNAELIDAWAADTDEEHRAALIAKMDRHCETTSPVPLAPLADMQARFAALKAAGLKTAIVTNDTTASARNTARAFGISAHVDFICGFDAVTNPKPAPDPVLAFTGLSGVVPERMAVIGDNIHDAEMAQAAGCALFIGVLSGNSGHADLAHLADALVADVCEAVEYLLSHLATRMEKVIDWR